MADQEPVVDPEPADVAVIARVGVQRLLLRGEGIEQRESGLAVDVLVVPREQELDRNGDSPRRLDQGLVHDEPAAEDRGGRGVLGWTPARPLNCDTPSRTSRSAGESPDEAF